jgi:hypothetical protein
MEYRQQEIVKLNQIGTELYQLHKVLAASFHFNEALSLLSKISAEREEEQILKRAPASMQAQQPCASSSSSSNPLSAPSFQPKINHKLHRSLLQPLALDPTLPLAQPKDWDRVYALTIFHNIALTHYATNCFPKAEKMLRLALRLLSKHHQSSRFRHFGSSRTTPGSELDEGKYHYYGDDSDEQYCHFDIYSHVDLGICIVIMSIYHMLGTVISQISGRSIQEILQCYMEAIHAGKQLGGHVLIASIFVSMGRTLIQEGCIIEASYVYDMAKCIYSTLQAGDTDEGFYSCLSTVGCQGAPAA